MSSVKVLVSGDPGGKLSTLFKRVAAVNKSNGPFDYLFCVGSFFPPSGADGDAEDPDQELLEYMTRNRDVPIPTYFIGGFGRGSDAALAALAGTPDSNLHYLGAAGVAKLRGLNVAFLDGLAPPADGAVPARSQHGCRYHSQADVARVTTEVEQSEGDVDLLLTCEWSADVAGGLPTASMPAGANAPGSDAVARLAVSVRPRYHFSGGKGVFWARPPYMNKDLGAGPHATRFVGLAAVGNAAKQKSLHALGLVPAAAMLDRAPLTAQPPDATPSPYDAAAERRKRSASQTHDQQLGVQDWRWQDRKKSRHHAPPSLGRPGVVKDDAASIYVRNLPFLATEADLEAFFCQAGPVADIRRGANAEGKLNGFGHIQFADAEAVQRALALHGADLMGREIFVDAASNRPGPAPLPAGRPVDGCWFCLSNPNADVELVASVGEESYVAVDKGAIGDGHVLVLPIEHYPNSLGVPPSTAAEMDRYLAALQSCYAAQGKQAVAFERFMAFRKSGGNHCHINVVPVPASAAETARATFDRAAAAIGAAFTELPRSSGEASRQALREAVGEAEFLRVVLPDSAQLVHAIPRGERFPINFGRDVAAAIVGTPDRADWKQCAVSPAEETARTERFKAAFKAHDIMQ